MPFGLCGLVINGSNASLKLDPLIFRQYQAYTQRSPLHRFPFAAERGRGEKSGDPTSRWCLPTEPKGRLLKVRKISLGILLTRQQDDLAAKLSFEALPFRPHQAYTQSQDDPGHINL